MSILNYDKRTVPLSSWAKAQLAANKCYVDKEGKTYSDKEVSSARANQKAYTVTSKDVGAVGDTLTITGGLTKSFGIEDFNKAISKANPATTILQGGLDLYEQTQKDQPISKAIAKTAGHFVINAESGALVGTLAYAHGFTYVETFGPEAPITYPVITASFGATVYGTTKTSDMFKSEYDDWIDNL